MTLHHIEINVKNLKKSFDFYQWLFLYLDYSLYQEWDKGFSYKKDSTYIVFVQTEEKYLQNDYHRKNIGLNHLAFICNLKIINNIHQASIEKKINLLYEDKYPHADGNELNSLFIEDPDRIKIELRDK